jgi:ATP-binding cassette subfamily B protein
VAGGGRVPATPGAERVVLKSLRRFAHPLSGRRGPLAAIFVLGLCGAAVTLSTPLLGMAFIDAVASRGDFTSVPIIAAALVALSVVDLALATLSGRVHARLSAEMLADLRAALFARCVDGPLDAIEALRHGDLLTRFGTDVPRIQTLLVDGMLGGLQNMLFLGVAAVITFALSPALALWSFLGVFLALATAAAFRGAVEDRTRRVRDAMVDLSHFLSERLGALRAIRLHRTQHEEKARLAARSERLAHEVVRFHVQDSMATGVPGLALTLALAWIYVVGGGLLEAGTISLGTFVAFVLYQGRLFGPAQGLLALVRNLQEARVSLARIAEVLGAEDAGAPSVHAVTCDKGTLVLTGVRFAYAAKPAVFDHVNLRIEAGERVALFGASGAGKSTLVHLLFGLREPIEGRVSIDGWPAHDVRLTSGPTVLAYAGAEPFLLHATVEENVRYGNPGAQREDLERAVALAEAEAFIEALPAGYAAIIGGRGLALSDGQRQRLGLARLFLRDPRILVLDEAFSALDLETERRIRRNLWNAFPNRTALVISHRPVGLADFDRILLLHDGRFATVSPDEIRSLVFAAGRANDRTATAVANDVAHVR